MQAELEMKQKLIRVAAQAAAALTQLKEAGFKVNSFLDKASNLQIQSSARKRQDLEQRFQLHRSGQPMDND